MAREESRGYELVLVRGVPQNPLFDVGKFEALIADFEGRDSDVWVCTFVKAGTTWTQQIVTLLLNGGQPGQQAYGEAVPWLEALCATTEILPEREAPGWTLDRVRRAAGPRYFKSHARVDHLPGGGKGKVIALARNPKDTAVSLFHHARSKPEFKFRGDFAAFLDVFLAGQAENGDWFAHVTEWHARAKADPARVLWLTYEDLVRDHRAAVKRIADFLGLDATDQIIDDTVEHSTITSMQANANIGLNHLRKGGVGRWRDTFTVSQSDHFDRLYKRSMADSGLSFDFGDGLSF
mmetsp:Transcript_38396/g.123128  ORF Transcript_38396/g.123128 Transcript_38396/m.123128 type:complete len:293 (-) Transcript_38396:191-1069(-)